MSEVGTVAWESARADRAEARVEVLELAMSAIVRKAGVAACRTDRQYWHAALVQIIETGEAAGFDILGEKAD